jgi:hypothetical protein
MGIPARKKGKSCFPPSTLKSLTIMQPFTMTEIKCRLCSIDKARDILKFQLQHLQETSESFFAPFHWSMQQTSLSSDEDSYLPSEQDDVTYTADTTDTLSLTDFSINTTVSNSNHITSSTSTTSSTVYIQSVPRFPKR